MLRQKNRTIPARYGAFLRQWINRGQRQNWPMENQPNAIPPGTDKQVYQSIS